jgi:hypothetical protein
MSQQKDELDRSVHENAAFVKQLKQITNDTKGARLLPVNTEATESLKMIERENIKLKLEYQNLQKQYQQDVLRLQEDNSKLSEECKTRITELQLELKTLKTQQKIELENASKEIQTLSDNLLIKARDADAYWERYTEYRQQANGRIEQLQVLLSQAEAYKESQSNVKKAMDKAQRREVELQSEIEKKNEQLDEIPIKAEKLELNTYLTNQSWIVLHDHGTNCLVTRSQFEEFVFKHSISMVHTQIFHSQHGVYSVSFQKAAATTANSQQARVRIELEYETAMQLFAWMRDKFSVLANRAKKNILENITDGNILSREFRLQMQQESFKCKICDNSFASNRIVCLQCGKRMHYDCIVNSHCPFCRRHFISPGIDYAFLGEYPEMRPEILMEPLDEIKEEELRTQIGKIHSLPMQAYCACLN